MFANPRIDLLAIQGTVVTAEKSFSNFKLIEYSERLKCVIQSVTELIITGSGKSRLLGKN